MSKKKLKLISGSKEAARSGVEARWPGDLGRNFVPVSSYFLANYHRLRPHEGAAGLTSTEVLVIIHLLDFKWTDAAPFPTLGTIAKRMGLSKRSIRNALQTLEELGYVRRVRTTAYGPNRFFFEGLYEALEALMAEDVAMADEEDEA